MNARELMSLDITWIAPDATIASAAQALSHGRTRCVLIGHPDRPPLGIVTAVDVLRAALGAALKPRNVACPEAHDRMIHGDDLTDARMFAHLARAAVAAPVSSVMSSPVRCVRHDAAAAEVTDLLIRRKIESLPVLDGSRVVGLIHRRALLGALDRLMEAALSPQEARPG
jgi:CBS domain-containing protein